ncbi:serine/threonine-protein kinase [Sinomonas terrae]|uniref:Serine/threonine protein kinase n=1 Tax=Sinomonas terrae TaxID=2908838 RepID=A0ABS9U6L7_9MICC|nr:serine/threonine-protein kinase [Sinomonas terrae]MCH6472344.1 serine/threonine protein kinase [Sinomonas terrae]
MEGQIVAESDTGLKRSLMGGRYRLLEVAGSGAMATVYRARDEVLGRIVGVKVFRAHSPDPRSDRRRRGEMEVLARLNHPSLVRLYDVGTETSADGKAQVTYLVMEFLEGTDLRQRLRQGPLSGKEVQRLGADLASALAYIHALDIVHRDIKPANVIVPDPAVAVGPRRPAKLTDFGIARVIDATRVTQTNTTIGTAHYLSPEQARGEVVGPPSDVYSLGLVLLEALTGHIEYPGSAVESAVARLLREPRVPAELGAPWTTLLPWMMAKEPSERPTPIQVAQTLEAAANAAVGAPEPAGSMPTEVIPPPSAGANDGATRLLPAGPPPKPPQAPSASPRPAPLLRRPFVWVAAAVVVLALITVIPLALRTAPPNSGPTPIAPGSPHIPGPLGSHIAQLERSVRP